MSTSPVSSAAAATAAAAAAPSALGALGPNTFLTLLTTQLQNQDPMNPMNSQDFVAQLAQLTSVSSLQSMQSSLSALSSAFQSSQALSGAALVGHTVLTAASSVTVSAGQGAGGAVQVPAGTSAAEVLVTDASGQIVRHLPVAATTGNQSFSWDGRADDGSQAPAGTYGLTAVGNVSGTPQALTTLLSGHVTSVSMNGQGQAVTLNTTELGSVALSAVVQIG